MPSTEQGVPEGPREKTLGRDALLGGVPTLGVTKVTLVRHLRGEGPLLERETDKESIYVVRGPSRVKRL